MCNGICQNFAISRNPLVSMYSLGFVSCNSCADGKALYLKKEDCVLTKGGRLACPCCLLPVRFSPRGRKNWITVRN